MPTSTRDELNVESLLDAASFSPRSTQPPSGWIGHLPLGAWVVRQLAPSIFVELGTHTGNSYFSLCQSVVEGGLATNCYAVDTWQGDAHSGEYDEKVFADVDAHNAQHYAGFSRLLRMTFDAALEQFADSSIELLHLDGLHTYEAARHDFEAWLPKLAPGAVVIFHDTNVREQDFGVWKLWEELQRRYPSNIEFPHSHGLGILQLNNAPKNREQKWLQLGDADKERLRTYFAALGSMLQERFELKARLAIMKREIPNRDIRIAHLDNLTAELRQHASNLLHEVDTRDAIIAELRQHASNLQLELASRGGVVGNLSLHASNLTQELSNRELKIADLNRVVKERDDRIAQLAHDAEAVRQSTSWRVTAPLRWLARAIRRA